jgi:hypothetical protein
MMLLLAAAHSCATQQVSEGKYADISLEEKQFHSSFVLSPAAALLRNRPLPSLRTKVVGH